MYQKSIKAFLNRLCIYIYILPHTELFSYNGVFCLFKVHLRFSIFGIVNKRTLDQQVSHDVPNPQRPCQGKSLILIHTTKSNIKRKINIETVLYRYILALSF